MEAGAITAWREWLAYAAQPRAQTFGALAGRGEAENRVADVITECIALWRRGCEWRVAQHIALLHQRHGHLSEAWYYAAEAVRTSNRDAFALAALAEVFEERSLPTAALPLLEELRLRTRRIRDRSVRRRLNHAVAEARVRVHCYLHDLDTARRWLRWLTWSRGAQIRTWAQLLSLADGRDQTAALMAARTIVNATRLNPDSRLHMRALRVLRLGVLDTVRARATASRES
jgi:hypothetical protein